MITASFMCIPTAARRRVSEQEWAESCPLDAPMVLCAGSHQRREYLYHHGLEYGCCAVITRPGAYKF
jgi:hypothetical protein